MLLLLLAAAFFVIGWFLSGYIGEYLEENWPQYHRYLFGNPKEDRSVSQASSTKCFCKAVNCQRFVSHDVTFHEKQYVTERISDSLESLFNCVLDRYVTKWYTDISDNNEFVDDIKMNLHFICDNALYRLRRSDIAYLVCRRIAPTIARHLHMCLMATERNRSNASHHQNQDDRLLEKLSGHLHIAMHSRSTEQLYIRSLVTAILPYLLQNTVHVHSKATILLLEELLSVAVLLPSLDVLANPDIVNKLIVIGLNNEPPAKPSLPVSRNVEILHNYHKAYRSRLNVPIPVSDIQSLYGNTVLFHQFMQYLKALHLVDLLNVFGQLDEINSKVLQPEIPDAVKHAIHRDLSTLHESLAHQPALLLLQLPDTFLSDILKLATGPPSEVGRLQTCDSWFKAYDNVCRLLETVLLPQFFQSDCFFDAHYSSMPGHSTPRSNSSSKRKDFSLAKFTGKVKDILKLQSVVEGEFPPGPPPTQTAEDAAVMLLPQGDYMSDESPRSECPDDVDESETDVHVPDLSTWEISMPTISQGYHKSLVKSETLFEDAIRRGSALAPNFSPTQLTFVIEVRESGDDSSASWRIHRRYQEFYVLHEKLCEFHGSHLHDVFLPSKKNFGIKNVDFLERMKPEFLQYLTKLLSKPFLHNSELLYRFLRQSDLEFNSSINLGRFVKSVNIKLIKTRGQHLGNFLQTLQASTEGRKPVPRANEPVPGKSLRATCLHNHSFWNNAVGAVRLRQAAIQRGAISAGCDQHVPRLRGILDVVDWVVQWVSSELPGVSIQSPDTSPVRYPFAIVCLRGILRSVNPFLGPFVDGALQRLITNALKNVLHEHRVAPIVENLRDILFFDSGNQRTRVEKQERREKANQAVLNLLLHPPLHFLFDREQLSTQLHDVFSLLQLPKVNKQLSYILLDDVVQELFPEISVSAIKEKVAETVATSLTNSDNNSPGSNGDILT